MSNRSSEVAKRHQRSSKTGYKTTSLASDNVANILLFNFCEQKFVQHDPITIAIDCNDLSLLILKEKWPYYDSGPKSAPNSDSFWVRRHTGFLYPKCEKFACLHTSQDQNEVHLKR